MDSNMKFWEKTAKMYAPIQERSNRLLYESVVEHCKPYISSETRVLELACGSAQLTIPLCRFAKSWEATDFSPKMIETARKRCKDAVFSVQDACNLPYEDESFDLVLIANALHIMPEPEKALKESRRVLVPGGILIAPTFVYEGKVNRLRMKLTSLVGFKSYGEWTLDELVRFTESAGFELMEKALLPGSPLPEGFAALRKTL